MADVDPGTRSHGASGGVPVRCSARSAHFAAIALASALGGWGRSRGLIVAHVGGVAWFLNPSGTRRTTREPAGARQLRRRAPASSWSRTRPSRARKLHDAVRPPSPCAGPRGTRRLPGAELAAPALRLGRGRRARRRPRSGSTRSLHALADAGIDARGEVGDADPLQAIDDALRTFGADEIIISTHPEGRSNWLERGIVDSARQRFTVPITHVVVDLGA